MGSQSSPYSEDDEMLDTWRWRLRRHNGLSKSTLYANQNDKTASEACDEVVVRV